ncbi:MAG: hypothetical protein MUC88_05525 [Planctomycetes bacterium]|jgi:hypothetical protein|nr:hypothetical protein [Planctomycetota bacterium]
MRRAGLFLRVGVMVVGAALCVGAVAPVSSPGSSEIEQLRQEVAALRQRIELLEERLRTDLVPAAVKKSTERPDVINPYPSPRRTPPNWRSFEFNGMPCYICPIEATEKPDGAGARPIPPQESPAASQAAGRP